MKIGILSWILDRQRTGIDNYLYNIILEMIKDDKSKYIYLFHFKKSNDTIYNKTNEVIVPTLPLKFNFPIGFKKAIKNNKIDVFHFPSHWPNQISPFFLNTDFKTVITIHDLIPLLFSENLPFIYRFWAPTLKIIKNRADYIIVDSENTKNDCIKHLKIPEEKIKVIYLAVNDNFRYFDNKMKIKAEIENEYKLDGPFILYVGNVELRKNIPILIKSFFQLKKRGFKHKLVLIGNFKHGFEKIKELVNVLGLYNEVIFMGYVPESDLVKFYNAAELFVFPSIYEGFGLPPLEAMACGCPVITSNTSSLPEVIDDAGILIEPYEYGTLADQMQEVLINDSLREDLSKKSLKRSKMFTWKKTAYETWKLYKEVLDR